MTSRRVREHLGAAQPLELLLQYGHIDGGAVEAVLQHDELRRCNERRWRHAEKKEHFARSSMPTRRQVVCDLRQTAIKSYIHSRQARDRYSHDSEQAEVTPNRLRGRPPESRNVGVRGAKFAVLANSLTLAPPEQQTQVQVKRDSKQRD